jgi:hypothetical protein
MKTDGSRHRLCERHREEARINQRNYVDRQREWIELMNRRASEANTGTDTSMFIPIDMSQPCGVEGVLTVLRRQDLISSEGLTAVALDSLDNIPSNEPLRMPVNDGSEEATRALLAQFEPWLPEFIRETYESVMADS